jgi:hypothetical protein
MTHQRTSRSASRQANQPSDPPADQLTNRPNKQPSSLPAFQSSSLVVTIARWVLLVGLLLAALGASFAPWVARPAAALMLTAPDLAEFVKFLPEVRDGSLRVHRLLFLLPLFVATFALPLVVTSRRLTYPCLVRWSVLVFVIPLSLTLLPPVWSPAVLLSAEFRLQTVACLVCLGLTASSRWLGSMPTRPLIALLIPLSLAAPALALWQFFGVREAVTHAYASPIAPGWGTWLTVLGFASVVLGALIALFGLRAMPRPNLDQ